jgi:hypothetical protein
MPDYNLRFMSLVDLLRFYVSNSRSGRDLIRYEATFGPRY